MLKLLIVDDEPMFREGLIHTIDWDALGVTIAGEAYNGLEALKFIEREDVDLVITDIRMPELDGIELIRRVCEIRPYIRFIVLSAYGDFSQVKQAFQLGIVDYILKSDIDGRELEQIILRQKEEFGERREIGDEEMSSYNRRTRRMFIQQLLRNCVDRRLGLGEIPELTRYLGIEEGGALFCIVMQLNHINPSVSSEELSQERMRGRELVENHLQDSEEWIGYWDSQSLILFFRSRSPVDWQLFSGRAEVLRRDLSHAFRSTHPDLEPTVGMSSFKPTSNPFRLKNEAEKACLYSYFRGIGRCISYQHYQRSLEQEMKNCETLFRQFSALLDRRDLDTLKDGIDRFLIPPLKGNGGQRQEIQDLFRKYFYHLRSFCDQPVLESLNDMFLEFSSLEAGGAPLECYNEWLRRTVVQVQAKMAMSLSLSHRVARYLETRYQGDVSLSEVAEHLQVNPSYLSRAFSKESGKGFAQYLQELRIHKAQKLMEESPLKIYEVAEMVGFQSPESFSRAFKKVTGTSPGKYFH